MIKPIITRRHFLKKAGLVGVAGLTMIIGNKTEGAMLDPIKTGMNYDYPKQFRVSETRDAAIAMPTTRREFTRVVDKIEDYKSTVLAFTDLIIDTYGGRR